jgi:PhoPQ-activated pathogenicity-related protein
MQRRITRLCLFSALLVSSLPSARADLKSYFAKPEPAYKWEKRGQETRDGVTIYDLNLVSQVWQGHTWQHRVMLFRPEKLDHPNHCLLYNTGGSGSNQNTAMGIILAKSTGTNYAILYNSPNQPLYGLTEDALIVYTWKKFLETGDEDWPLHFPMAKSVLKAMDALGEFSKQAGLPAIDSFIINGGSKRGWTTWLAGASQDKRIKAIAPMVIDILNVAKQIPHQLEAFGKPSEQVGDYTAADMQQVLMTPKGKRLLELEDPYSYRDILTLPKLLILGTNDRYWSQDALNLYWDDLKGPKWVSYTPNSGHGLEDREHVFATLSAFTRMVAGGKKWPKMNWQYYMMSDGAMLQIKSDIKPVSAKLFRVSAPTKDFRDYKWTSEPISESTTGYVASVKAPAEGYMAVFGEATYNIDGQPFTLSTQIQILGGKK